MNFISLFLSFIFLSACLSTEKHTYDSALEPVEEFQGTNTQRDIAYLKSLSQFEESSFEFVTKQMKTVIKNYGRMKQQLEHIDGKLDRILNQVLSSAKNLKMIPEEESSISLLNPDPEAIDEESAPLLEPDNSTEESESLFEDSNPQPRDEKNTQLDSSFLKPEPLKNQALNPVRKPDKISSLSKAKNLFNNKSYESAISEFQKYRDENPQGPYYPEATFYIGQSFKNLKMPVEANVFFKEIVQSYPQSLWASRAKKKLKE